jgi:hypothetical protein
MQLLKLVFSTTLIIFNYINFANCFPFFGGGDGYLSIFIDNKLYYLKSLGLDFFYVDLTDVSLDSDVVVNTSKWVDLKDIKPKPEDLISKPILGGKANNEFFFLDSEDIKFENVYKFDTTLNQWIIKPEKIPKPKGLSVLSSDLWVSDEKTGKAYAFGTIFDTINLVLTQGSKPGDFIKGLNPVKGLVQVLLPNGQILYIGGGFGSFKQPMNSIITYDTIANTWQMTV